MALLNTCLARKNETLLNHVERMIQVFDNLCLFDDSYSQWRNEFIKMAMFHDISKVIPSFQSRIAEDSEEIEHIASHHNILSYCFVRRRIQLDNCALDTNEALFKAILFHHTLGCNTDDTIPSSIVDLTPGARKFYHLSDGDDILIDCAIKEAVDILDKEYGIVLEYNTQELEIGPNIDSIPYYMNLTEPIGNRKTMRDIVNEGQFHFFHSLLVMTDRIAASHAELSSNMFFTKYGLNPALDVEEMAAALRHKANFDEERFAKQREILSVNQPLINMKFPCGYGKTIAYLLKIVSVGRKALIICNTNDLSNTTYNNVIKDLNNLGVTMDVGLFYGGKYIHGGDNSDIIITNIDTFSYKSLRNNLASNKFDLFVKTIVFDECHEYIETNGGINNMYLRTLLGRMAQLRGFKEDAMCQPNNFGVVINSSATTPAYLSSECLKSYRDNMVELSAEPQNKDCVLNISFADIDDADAIKNLLPESDCIIYTPTRRTTQLLLKSTSPKEIEYGIHSNFADDTIKERTQSIVDNWGESSPTISKGNIVGTTYMVRGVNYTTNKMIAVLTTPSTLQQLIGRVLRFDKQGEADIILLNLQSPKSRHIQHLYDQGLYELFAEYVKTHLCGRHTIGEVYELLKQFETDNVRNIKGYYNQLFFKSSAHLSKLHFIKQSKAAPDDEKRLPTNNSESVRNNTVSIFAEVKRDGRPDETIALVIDKNRELYDYQGKNVIDMDLKAIRQHMVDKLQRYMEEAEPTESGRIRRLIKKIKNEKLTAENLLNYAFNERTPLLLTEHGYNDRIGLYKKS